ncbi:MAG: hypothetical protein JWO05_3939 [Gemmatimonadetes bacterium]|nr:hypothetical protein [Gemmatimonadota bacterium]
MSREEELLTEIRDLLQVMAEPAIAQRDAKLRATLRGIMGGSEKRSRAIQLMDGSRTQTEIAKESGYDRGDVSKLVKALSTATLVSIREGAPKLLISVPSQFFDKDYRDEQ